MNLFAAIESIGDIILWAIGAFGGIALIIWILKPVLMNMNDSLFGSNWRDKLK